MESLASARGDLEELVAIKSQDLSSARRYLAVAELYRKARKRSKAIEWAERGLEAFPERTDPRLREFLADLYHQRKRHDDATALVWDNFADSPSLATYQSLSKHAERAGQWPQWRQRAIDRLREEAAKQQSRRRGRPWALGPLRYSSALVAVFLWEKDVEAAWNEAQASGCTHDLWLELADLRASDHPADALRYKTHALRLLDGLSTQGA